MFYFYLLFLHNIQLAKLGTKIIKIIWILLHFPNSTADLTT